MICKVFKCLMASGLLPGHKSPQGGRGGRLHVCAIFSDHVVSASAGHKHLTENRRQQIIWKTYKNELLDTRTDVTLKNNAPVLSATEQHLPRDRQLHSPAGSTHRLSYTDATQRHRGRDYWYSDSGKFTFKHTHSHKENCILTWCYLIFIPYEC